MLWRIGNEGMVELMVASREWKCRVSVAFATSREALVAIRFSFIAFHSPYAVVNGLAGRITFDFGIQAARIPARHTSSLDTFYTLGSSHRTLLI